MSTTIDPTYAANIGVVADTGAGSDTEFSHELKYGLIGGGLLAASFYGVAKVYKLDVSWKPIALMFIAGGIVSFGAAYLTQINADANLNNYMEYAQTSLSDNIAAQQKAAVIVAATRSSQ